VRAIKRERLRVQPRRGEQGQPWTAAGWSPPLRAAAVGRICQRQCDAHCAIRDTLPPERTAIFGSLWERGEARS
jgi:hypothetical protein